jgi:hypothetical protein
MPISLTRFVENISNICISKNFVMKINSMIYLMILIMYLNINIFFIYLVKVISQEAKKKDSKRD